MNDVEKVIVECCGSCECGREYWGYEWFCHRLKKEQGKDWKQEDNTTEPWLRCDHYKLSGEIKEGETDGV